jgi:hypothetical protein
MWRLSQRSWEVQRSVTTSGRSSEPNTLLGVRTWKPGQSEVRKTTRAKQADLQLCSSEHRHGFRQRLVENGELAQRAYEEGHEVSCNEARILEIESSSRYRKCRESAHVTYFIHSTQPAQFLHLPSGSPLSAMRLLTRDHCDAISLQLSLVSGDYMAAVVRLAALGYIWAALFLGDINTGTWPPRLGESQMREWSVVMGSEWLTPLSSYTAVVWVNYRPILSAERAPHFKKPTVVRQKMKIRSWAPHGSLTPR